MLNTTITTNTSKKFNANKVYVPATNRENHYLIVELPITSELLQTVSGETEINEFVLSDFYMQLKQSFISISKRNGIKSGLFVANDKLVRLRYGEESQVIETQEQLIVFYDPNNHKGFQSYYDRTKTAKKVSLLVLANGGEIRQSAFELHQKAVEMAVELAETMGFSSNLIKIKDHQYITYDLFSAEKGDKKTSTHELRQVKHRYKQQSVLIPPLNNQMGYIVAEIPINETMVEKMNKTATHTAPYNELYSKISYVVAQVTDELAIKNAVMIANGRHPIVASSKHSFVHNDGELIYLGFNAEEDQNCIAKWNSTILTNTFTLIFVANENDINNKAYGRFVNRIQSALKQITKKLDIEPESNQLMVRFHQNIAYQIPKMD
ncbi:DUF3083 family protein [uncultured Psychrosphaera sp.]|uniref:DUF3083 family protein n=1 Tax=uncultured Psychrosphaera sp. TaxID=1403522 RepID=UPI002605578D|nr:DUF3083 family protein [uncultured Psychrosphaera sp.]